MVVLIILAILSAVASTTLRSHLDNAAVERAYEQFVLAHSLARRTAMENTNPSELGLTTIEVNEDQLEILGPKRKFKMPNSVRLELQVSSSELPRLREQIPFAGNGTSPTYAVKLESQEIWFIALGATGQCLRTNDPQFVEALLQ